ncbi:MAG: aspartate kinase [Armatimonadetes bacterium]|nr:aspartate kinase [Armatimonadota bacterium]
MRTRQGPSVALPGDDRYDFRVDLRGAGGQPSTGTEFEVRKGISKMTLEPGFALVHISRIPPEQLHTERLRILRMLADSGVSAKFPKLTGTGISLTIFENRADDVEKILETCGQYFSVKRGRSVLTIYAPNIREEEGLMSRIIGHAITAGVHIDHIGDMHDQTTMVIEAGSAEKLLQSFEESDDAPAQIDYQGPFSGKKVKVMKFGGSSIESAEARLAAAMKVVTAREMGFQPVVVIGSIGRKGLPYSTDTLVSLLQDIDTNISPNPRELDLIVSSGEALSGVVFAHTLKTLGHNAEAFRGGQAGIETDGEYGNSRIVAIRPERIEKCLLDGNIPVICGFQGTGGAGTEAAGEVTTLGRGGSDTTASAMAVALGADSVEIYSDVDGIKTANPNVIPEAQTLHEVTYGEVAAVSHLGAKVVHPRAVDIALTHGIPLWIKNTFSDDPGTRVVVDDEAPERRITGVIRTGRLVYLKFDLSDASPEDRAMLEGRIYETMAENGISLFMINISTKSTGFAIPRSSFPLFAHLCDGLVLPSVSKERSAYLLQVGEEPSPQVVNQTRLLASLAEVHGITTCVTPGCSMVSIVGHEYIERPGVLVAILSVLNAAGISVLQTSDSNYSLSLLVPEAETNRTVRLLFDYFDLGTPE